MKVQFLTRKSNYKEQSIEKLFTFIRYKLKTFGVQGIVIENPYDFGLLNIFRSAIYFRRRQNGCINHIIGDIHWACMFLNRDKTVLTIHDIGRYNELSGIRKFIFYLFWIYIPVKRVKYITTISEKTKEDILCFFPKKIIQVIPNCVTITIDERIRLNINEITKILIVGTRSNKNIENSIRALANLKIELNIVGELNLMQIEILEQNNIKYNTYHFINENELEALYRTSDILLFPSYFEGFGLPILEAQAQNTIVITSDLPPMNKVAGKGAILVDPYSVESISMGIVKALNFNANEKLTRLHQGKENVKLYSIENVSRQYMRIYENIL